MTIQIKATAIEHGGLKTPQLKKNILRNLMISGFALALMPNPTNAVTIKNQSPDMVVRKVAYGHLVARTLHVACYYKLFDTLQKGSKRAEEMVSGTTLKADIVKRMMRVLANHGIVTMDENEGFSLTDQSQLLVTTTPNSLQPAFAKEFDLKRWEAIGNIHKVLDNELNAFEQLNGASYYAYLEGNKDASQLFNNGMKNFSEGEDAQVASADIFKNFKTYCDIGGGTGGLISKVLQHHPEINAILLDLAEAVALCKIPNIEKVFGSFFEKIPPAEVYTIKRVLHNWKDNECITILTNTKTALTDKRKGRILVIEKVLPQKVDGSLLIDSDIVGIALGGRERTLGEFIDLGHKAGLDLEDQIVLSSGISILIFKSAS